MIASSVQTPPRPDRAAPSPRRDDRRPVGPLARHVRPTTPPPGVLSRLADEVGWFMRNPEASDLAETQRRTVEKAVNVLTMTRLHRVRRRAAVTRPVEGPPEPPADRLGDGGYRRHRLHLLATSGVCAYCGVPLTERTATLDHVIPRDRGGPNTAENTVIACPACNSSKSNRTIAEWIADLLAVAARVAG